MTAYDLHEPFDAIASWHDLRVRTLPRQRRQRALRAVLGLAIIGVLAGNLYVLSQRNVTTAVTFDDALRNFRAAGGTGASPVALAPASPDATPDGGAGAQVSIPRNDAQPVPGKPAPAADEPQAVRPVAPFFRPAEGVYAYRTTGGESISVTGASHHYPERTFATVHYGDGCNWEIRNDVIQEHVDRRIFCSQYESLTQLVQERQVEFFGQRDGMTVTCDPPQLMSQTGEAISAVTTATCGADRLSVKIRRTVAGYGGIPVDGRTVPAVHILIDATFTGRADGTAHEDLWFTRDTGMTLRWQRTVDTVADAAFGARVRYQEDATFVLESLVPQT